MAKKGPPGEPPPERPFGQDWPRDREQSRKTKKVTPPTPVEGWAKRTRRLLWRRMLRPFLVWGANLVKRACDELLVFSLKAVALMAIVALLGGSFVALTNYSLRQIVDTVVATVSKQHGIEPEGQSKKQAIAKPAAAPSTAESKNQIETGSVAREPPSTGDTQQASPTVAPSSPPHPVVRRRSSPPKPKPFFDNLIDRIDEALGWKKT